MKLKDLIKKELLIEYRIGVNNIKLNFFIAPIYLLSHVAFYYFYKDSLAENGFIVIFGPMLIALILALFYLIPKRNNPDYQIYYIFHPTKFVLIGILVSAILCLVLFLYTQ